MFCNAFTLSPKLLFLLGDNKPIVIGDDQAIAPRPSASKESNHKG